jgi:hypothetical protein
MIAPIGAGREAAADWGFVNENPALRPGLDGRYDFASYLNDSLTFAR